MSKGVPEQNEHVGVNLGKLKNTKVLVIVFIVIVVIAALAGYFYIKNSNKYHTSDLVSYSLPITKDQPYGFSFKLPPQLSKVAQTATSVAFLQAKHGKKQLFIAATAPAKSQNLTANKVVAFNNDLSINTPESTKFESQNISQYAATWFAPAKPQVKVTKISRFVSKNLKQTSWEAQLNIQNNSNHYTGAEIVSATPSGYHYFMVIAMPQVWQSNSGIWQQMLNSYKLH